MKPENAIEVHNITKKFKIFLDKGKTLKERTLFSKRRKHEVREVLKGISFEVKKGEAIGLIGHNGCGKSTTLKMLTKIMYPDSGTIEMNGRVSSLIELGAGFHPDMSGRENIYINASIFGLNKAEIEKRIKDIIEFSELEQFIDNPVRTYSSGMYMRLAFAVAINVDADILLIDEILGVGDMAFQAKCFNKLRQIKSEGTTIVIVSHSLNQIEQICERSIWIHDGLIRAEGSPYEVHPLYISYMADSTLSNKTASRQLTEEEKANFRRWGSKEIEIEEVKLLDVDGNETDTFFNTDPIKVHIRYSNKTLIESSVVGFAIHSEEKVAMYGSNTLIDMAKTIPLKESGEIVLNIDRIPLNAGKYMFDFSFQRPDGFDYDFWRDAVRFKLKNAKSDVGIISLAHSWEYEE